MSKSFHKYKLACASVLFVGLLALFVNHLMTSAITAGRVNEFSVSKQVAEIEGYRKWTKVNSMPELMPRRVAIACAMWVSPNGVIIDGDGNPHRDKYFTVFVNEVGREAMLDKKNPKFPVGSVIVKEKLPAKDSREPELLTVMIKQKKGFNPASGDWEYMVVDGTGTKLQGRGNLENCQSCHVGYKKTDYIFRTYLPAEVRNRLK